MPDITINLIHLLVIAPFLYYMSFYPNEKMLQLAGVIVAASHTWLIYKKTLK